MAEASIPVDLMNPGQVFACLGFMEAAEILIGNVRGGFDWSDETDIRFRLQVDGSMNPVQTVLQFLSKSSVRSITPIISDLTTEKWNIPTSLLDEKAPFPFPLPKTPATLPALLFTDERSKKNIVIDYWGDDKNKTSRDNVKFWAGSGGYPGVALARDGLDLIRNKIDDAIDDPFNFWVEQSSSFRLDWRRDYIPLEIGFSINKINKKLTNRFKTVGYPIVEMLGAIGLTNARPDYISKLEYRYGVLGILPDSGLFDPFFLRASIGAPSLPFPLRTFRMNLGWPGKKGQARCITTVYEEQTNE
jgi:CRISPR-associated protein Csx14